MKVNSVSVPKMTVPKLYRNNKRSSILSALTFNDAALWGADVFVGVIFALFITGNIQGGTAIQVGFIFGLYRLVRAFAAIPIGSYLDRHRGHIDEFYALFTAGIITAIAYVGLFFSFQLWHVYVGMAVIGIGHAIDISAWRILFYGNIPKQSEGMVIGVYETVMQVVYSLSIILAGFIGEVFGFEWTMLLAAFVTVLGSLVLLTLKPELENL